ncbi:hypothetical protein GGI22_007073, partial [Coemansia erecta]
DYASALESVSITPSAKKRSFAEPEGGDLHPSKRSARIVEVDDSAMTLEDQEQLALKLLSG